MPDTVIPGTFWESASEAGQQLRVFFFLIHFSENQRKNTIRFTTYLRFGREKEPVTINHSRTCRI